MHIAERKDRRDLSLGAKFGDLHAKDSHSFRNEQIYELDRWEGGPCIGPCTSPSSRDCPPTNTFLSPPQDTLLSLGRHRNLFFTLAVSMERYALSSPQG